MRLIDADELVAQMEADAEHMDGITAKMLAYAAISDVNHAPTVDALQVIRCKDCLCWDTSWKPTRAIEGAYWCSNNDIYTESDDYCSLAERKKNEQTTTKNESIG